MCGYGKSYRSETTIGGGPIKAEIVWSGMRIDEDRHARKFLEWMPREKRPRGKPMRRWKQSVDESWEERENHGWSG